MKHVVKSLYVEIKREEYDALRARVAEMESTLLRVVDTGELSRVQQEDLEADVCALTKAQQPSVVLPELRQVVTDALMGMIAAVCNATPPADQPPPPFIQSAIDRAVDRIARINVSAADAPFQARILPWLLECFGEAIASDSTERNHRFLEEALELVQACDCTPDEAHKLVDYVFGRRVGERAQEVGGVMVTLAALCLAQGLDMHQAGETELSRITQPVMVELIREKQKAKPAMSPLPGVYQERTEAATAHRRPNPAHGAPKPKGHNPVA